MTANNSHAQVTRANAHPPGEVADFIDFAEVAAPATPAAGRVRQYAKADGKLYQKDDAGVETDLAAAGGGALGAWTAYTPTWAASGGATTLGNGTLVGRYKALDSKTYAIQITLIWGSTTSSTGSTWSFSLPSGVTSAASVTQILAGHIADAGTDHKLCIGKIGPSATTIAEIVPEGGNTVTPTVPMTWANGDALNLTGIIEVA